MIDDVPLAVKTERCVRLNDMFRAGAEKVNKQKIGSTQLVLVEGVRLKNTFITFCS